MKKASIIIAISILNTMNSFAQQKETGRRSLKEIASSYTHDEQTNVLAFQGLLALLDMGLASKMYSAAKALQPDAIAIRDLEDKIRKASTEVQVLDDVEKKATELAKRVEPTITGGTLSQPKAKAETPDIGKVARIDELTSHQAIVDELNAKRRELSNLEGQLKKLKVGVLSRWGRKGITAVATTVGVVMVANFGARTYLVFVDGSDPGLFPVLDLAAEKVDSIGGQELIDIIANNSTGTVNDIYKELAAKFGRE